MSKRRACVDGVLGARGVAKELCCGAVAVLCPACLSRPVPLAQMGSAIRSQTEQRPCRPPPYAGWADRRTDRSASPHSSPASAAESGQSAGRSRCEQTRSRAIGRECCRASVPVYFPVTPNVFSFGVKKFPVMPRRGLVRNQLIYS
jgi:hypothetical protein